MNSRAAIHLDNLHRQSLHDLCVICRQCMSVQEHRNIYCSKCGRWVIDDILNGLREYTYHLAKWIEMLESKAATTPPQIEQPFPIDGVYIYFHPYERYKIGKAVNVLNRMEDHRTSARSLELLHVIKTSDRNWCEGFLQSKYKRKRIGGEYFDLGMEDLMWLFAVDVLEPPRGIAAQLRLLDLL